PEQMPCRTRQPLRRRRIPREGPQLSKPRTEEGPQEQQASVDSGRTWEVLSPFLMLPKQEGTMKRCSLMPHPLARGLMILQNVSSRDTQNPEGRQLRNQHSLSRSAQAVSRYYRKMSDLKDTDSPDGFVSEMQEMRRAFLRRPGCPQFSTRATSISQLGSGSVVGLPREVCVSPETWRMMEDPLLDRRGWDTGVDSKEPQSPCLPCWAWSSPGPPLLRGSGR
uniref:Coiled-coil domain containing 27 n=1 Tax=Urocitellus parryii TaxID=9999 RepID=A0A8D2HPL7_UROPR